VLFTKLFQLTVCKIFAQEKQDYQDLADERLNKEIG
jgi:hypothetical protein